MATKKAAVKSGLFGYILLHLSICVETPGQTSRQHRSKYVSPPFDTRVVVSSILQPVSPQAERKIKNNRGARTLPPGVSGVTGIRSLLSTPLLVCGFCAIS
jgi:hypothetical protein